ncbi:hypothetical protein AX15_001754 [Amanita polypyramis BW_CC]|nr:hypothetical protein AX15_001754 [Amanita polypyramis BW_CC]
MLHRVLHIPSPPSFSAALQAAASRAWSRCVSNTGPCDLPVHGKQHYRPHSTRLCTLSPSAGSSECRARLKRTSLTVDSQFSKSDCPPPEKHEKQARVTYIDPDDLTDEEINFVDPSQVSIEDSWENYTLDGTIAATVVGPHSPIHRTPLLPSPRSNNSLYQNLLYLVTHHYPIPSLPALIDYHDMHPDFQSTRSYNLLISFSLRHASTGTAQWLLESMNVKGVLPNLETWKLHVRWLVQTGRLEEAIKLVRNFLSKNGGGFLTPGNKQQLLTCPQQKNLLPIWLELFRPAKRGTIRCRTTSDCTRSVYRDSLVSLDSRHEYPGATAHVLRNLLSKEMKFLVLPETVGEMPPGLVHHMTWILLRARDTSTACTLTHSYLSKLPETISRHWARRCLDIVHLHLVHDSSLKGLPRFFETQRTLFAMLKHHRDIRPTSTTLLLLLAPLRRAKRCGSIAWKILKTFKSKYGIKVVDSRVRRRVVMLASKEGRMDIIDKILPCEQSFLLARNAWEMERDVLGGRELSPYKKLVNAPQRKVFRQNGKEQRAWHLLRRRLLSRMITKQCEE